MKCFKIQQDNSEHIWCYLQIKGNKIIHWIDQYNSTRICNEVPVATQLFTLWLYHYIHKEMSKKKPLKYNNIIIGSFKSDAGLFLTHT